MATIAPRKDKNGEIISYQIRVFRGRSADGKRLKDYTMTWKPTPGMTKRQAEKELDRQATLFEESCKQGLVSTEKPTFERYASYVLEVKKQSGLKAKTLSGYRQQLARAYGEIGPIKIQDLRPEHLNRLYAKLAQPGQRKGVEKATVTINLQPWLKEHKMSQQTLADKAHVGHSTVGAAIQGNRITRKAAEQIAAAMGSKFSDYFKPEKEKSAPLSPKTIMLTHKAISTVLKQAVKEQLLPRNIADLASPPKVPKHEMDTFEVEELQAILKALATEPLKWQTCIQLLIATGARRGEIMGLRWERVDWKGNRLYLCENRVYTPETGAISNSLKTDESRYVSVPSPVMELLKRWRDEQAKLFDWLGITPSGYVMTSEKGRPMHPDAPTNWLNSFYKRHDLPPIHPHKFRHTQASLLIAEGVDILTVSKRLGHSQTSTTMNIYAHALAKSDEHASEVFDSLVYQGKSGQSL